MARLISAELFTKVSPVGGIQGRQESGLHHSVLNTVSILCRSAQDGKSRGASRIQAEESCHSILVSRVTTKTKTVLRLLSLTVCISHLSGRKWLSPTRPITSSFTPPSVSNMLTQARARAAKELLPAWGSQDPPHLSSAPDKVVRRT